MARKRMIHPGFFTSMTLNALPVTTMLTFAGIWTWADDYGRGEWAPELVKAAVWPRRKAMTEAKVEAAMHELVVAGVLCYYEVADHALLHITAWGEFQQVSHPALPKLPPCPTHEPAKYEEFRNDSDVTREKFRTSSGGRPETFRRSVVEVSSDQISRGPRAIPNRHLSDATRRASLGIAGDD